MASEVALSIADRFIGGVENGYNRDACADQIDIAIASVRQQERKACELLVLERRDKATFRSHLWYILGDLADQISDINKETPDAKA